MSDTQPVPALAFPGLFASLVDEFAALRAVADSGGTDTFSGLEARSAAVARALLRAGVAKGAKVGILMPNGRDYLAALFGVLRIGAVGVLISTLSRPRELSQLILTADLDLLISADRYLGNDYVAMLEAALPGLAESGAGARLQLEAAPFLRAIWILGEHVPQWARSESAALADGEAIPPALLRAAEVQVVAADPALIIFTSGSSAEPKAVVHSQGSLVRQGKALAELMGGCGPGDSLLTVMPFFWVGGLCTVIMAALCSGAAVICPRSPSLEDTIACLRETGATHIMHWPQQLAMMKDNPEFRALLQQLRPAYAHQFDLFDLAPPHLTGNSLGMTETLGPHSMFPFGMLPEDKAGSFGTAVGGIEHRIIDPTTGIPLPPGQPGQLCLRGGALMIGMHRKSHAEVFDRDGFYRTDDIAFLDEDGHLFFTGRGGDMIKVSGANVSPVEVEGVIRTLPGVKAVCVVGVPIGGTDTLVAAVVSEAGAVLDAETMRGELRALLSSYKVPRHIVFLAEDDLPMTATAKIYKPALKQLLGKMLGA